MQDTVQYWEWDRFSLSANPPLPVNHAVANGSQPNFEQLLFVPGGLGGQWLAVSPDGTTAAWDALTTLTGQCPSHTDLHIGSIGAMNGQNNNSFGQIIASFNLSCSVGNWEGVVGLSFSPDGSQIVAGTLSDSNDYAFDLSIYKLDGTLVRQLTTSGEGPNHTVNWRPVWSSDNRIAFSSNSTGRFEIWTINADGSNLTQVTTNGGDMPTWSPDASKIAFSSNRSGTPQIYSVQSGMGACQVNVKRLYQAVDATGHVQPWACNIYNHPYGTESSQWCSPTPALFRIAQQGCALTALTMSLNTVGSSLDPGTLNQFMLEPQNAYDFGADHGVSFDTTVDDLSSSSRKTLAWNFFPSRAPQDLKQTLCSSGAPVVVGVDLSTNEADQLVIGHFVLVTGWDGTEFQIADPGYPLKTSLLDYDNQFVGAGYITDPPIGQSSLHISVTDAELLVTDPNGLKSGFDLTNSQSLSQIPTSAYSRMNLLNDETGEPGPQTGYYMDIHGPMTGTYTVIVQGLKLEQYNLAIRLFDANGNSEPPMSVVGIDAPGSSQTFSVQFLNSAGATSTVTLVASFQSTLDDIRNTLALGLIDNAGIANSLTQKIQAAQAATNPARSNILSAFRDEVNAQSGKHIKGVVPQVLLQDATSLLAGNQ